MADTINESDFMTPKLFHVRVVRLGMIHIVVGLATLAVGVLDVSFSSIAFDIFPIARAATGVWVGSVILLTGAAGVVTSRSDVRRRLTNLIFMTTSALSLILSVVMIGIAVAEIAVSEFVEGRMSKEKEILNITSCLNATQVDFRCVPTITFNQKLAAAIMLLILGFLESLVAYHSLLTSVAVAEKQDANRRKQSLGMVTRSPVDPSNVPVEAPYAEITEQEQNHNNDATTSNNDVTNHVSTPQGEFPDSEQFRAHLEGLEGNLPSNNTSAVD